MLGSASAAAIAASQAEGQGAGLRRSAHTGNISPQQRETQLRDENDALRAARDEPDAVRVCVAATRALQDENAAVNEALRSAQVQASIRYALFVVSLSRVALPVCLCVSTPIANFAGAAYGGASANISSGQIVAGVPCAAGGQ